MSVKTLRISEETHKRFLKFQGLLQAHKGEMVGADETLDMLLKQVSTT